MTQLDNGYYIDFDWGTGNEKPRWVLSDDSKRRGIVVYFDAKTYSLDNAVLKVLELYGPIERKNQLY